MCPEGAKHVAHKFLELTARCLDHAIGDSIIVWGFVRVQLFVGCNNGGGAEFVQK